MLGRTTEIVALTRNCDAHLVPSGEKITLAKNSLVTVVQALGGSYSVKFEGNLARIGSQDGDALGKAKPKRQPLSIDAKEAVTEQQVWDDLRQCYDPEIPVNIVDLGLIYACRLQQLPNGQTRIEVDMTLTAPGCGMGEVLVTDIEQRLQNLGNVQTVAIELVFDPPWDRSMMSDTAQLALGLY